MEKFTASNGWTVTELDDGQVCVARPSGNLEYVFWLGPTEVEVLREHFQAERDAELERWRWPENPDPAVIEAMAATVHDRFRFSGWDAASEDERNDAIDLARAAYAALRGAMQ